MTEVNFYEPSFDPQAKLTYSVIAARHKDLWLFVRHHKRDTWEIAGGHIEDGETPDAAAGRELMEETGALDFTIDCVATYSVTINGVTDYGRLFLAEVLSIGPVPDMSEIADVTMLSQLPANLTHPEIQPHLFRKAESFLLKRSAD